MPLRGTREGRKLRAVILRASLASRKDLGDGTLPAAQILWVAEAPRRMTRRARRLLARGLFRTVVHAAARHPRGKKTSGCHPEGESCEPEGSGGRDPSSRPDPLGRRGSPQDDTESPSSSRQGAFQNSCSCRCAAPEREENFGLSS